jgi:hypothetical protein
MSKSLNNKRAKKGEVVELNAAEISQIEALAVHGHTQQEISNYLGFSDRTFRNIKKRDEATFSAYTRGKMKAHNYVASRLMGYIKSDTQSEMSLKAIIFYLKTQAGWSEKQEMNVNTKDITPKMPPQIIFEVYKSEKNTDG